METLVSILTSTYETTSTVLLAYAPRLLATLVVVVVGLLVTRAAKAAVLAILEALKLDDIATRVGATAALKRADVDASMSEILARLVYWTCLVFTTMVALSAMGIADANMFANLGAMVPNVIVASVILVLGLNLSAFLSKVIQTASVNAEVRQARMARNVAHYGMGMLVMVLALRQLGVSEALLTQGFTILLASAGAGLALAFGFGARELASSIIASSWKREREQSQALAEASNLGRDVIPGVIHATNTNAPTRSARGRAATSTP